MLRLPTLVFVLTQLVVLCVPGTGSSQAPPTQYSPNNKNYPRNLPTALQSQAQFGAIPDHLEAESRSAYLRGLMPLDSRLKYLALARDARLSGSDISNEQSLEVWGAYRQQIAEIVPQIRKLNQPGAMNWASELAWAEYALVRADQQIASIGNDANAQAEAAGALRTAAHQLFQQRQADYSLGLATLLDLTYAKERYLAATDSSEPQRVQAFQEAKLLQERWNQQGAGIGREDQILESRMAEQLLGFQKALESGDPKVISEQLAELDTTGHQHFQTTMSYYRNGTAPLHQMTDSLILRQRLRQLEQEFPELKNPEREARFKEDWGVLVQAASSITDQRGRMTSDLLAVQLLSVSVEQQLK